MTNTNRIIIQEPLSAKIFLTLLGLFIVSLFYWFITSSEPKIWWEYPVLGSMLLPLWFFVILPFSYRIEFDPEISVIRCNRLFNNFTIESNNVSEWGIGRLPAWSGISRTTTTKQAFIFRLKNGKSYIYPFIQFGSKNMALGKLAQETLKTEPKDYGKLKDTVKKFGFQSFLIS